MCGPRRAAARAAAARAAADRVFTEFQDRFAKQDDSGTLALGVESGGAVQTLLKFRCYGVMVL